VEAKRKLAYTPATINAIAEDLGFVDPSNFTKFFKARTGTTPRAFRSKLGF
jgi:AraC-like DNA-binding protein